MLTVIGVLLALSSSSMVPKSATSIVAWCMPEPKPFSRGLVSSSGSLEEGVLAEELSDESEDDPSDAVGSEPGASLHPESPSIPFTPKVAVNPRKALRLIDALISSPLCRTVESCVVPSYVAPNLSCAVRPFAPTMRDVGGRSSHAPCGRSRL